MSLSNEILGVRKRRERSAVSLPPLGSSGGGILGVRSSEPLIASTYRATPKTVDAGDAFGSFKPAADTIGGIAGGIGSAVGGAFDAARKVPGVGGAFDALSALADATVRTPIGAAALAADTLLGTGLTRRATERAAGRPFYEVPKFAAEELSGAFGKVAEDPREDAIARLLAATARAGQTAGDFALPVAPGLGLVRSASRAPRVTVADRLADVAPSRPASLVEPPPATVTRPGVRTFAPPDRNLMGLPPREVARRVEIEVSAPPPSGPRIYGEMGTPKRDPRDLGFGQVFRDMDPEVQALIQREAVEAGGFATQRRGVRPIDSIKADADKYGLPLDELINTPAGRAMNAEEMWGTVKAVGRAAEERRIALDEIAKVGGPQHASTDQLAKAVLASVQQSAVQRVFAGARTEAGRTLRVLREALQEAEVRADPTGYDRALEAIGGRANAEQLVRRLVEINARNVPDAVKASDTYRFLRQVDEPGFFERVQEVWINSILSNPITNIVNGLSNTAMALTQPVTRFVAAGVDAAGAAIGRRPREIFFSEAGASAVGALRGIPDGARKAFHILKNGHSLEDVQRFVETGRLGRAQAIGGPVGAAINLPTRGLGAMDALFKTMGQQSELYALAARQASKEGLRGAEWSRRTAELIASPTKEMWDAALRQGKYVTFQSDPDRFTRQVMQLRNVAVPGTSLQPVRFVIPFIQTPTNLAKRGLEYSPAGFLRAIPTSGAERSMAIARAAIGTSVLAFFAPKFVSGEITASAPLSQAERDEFFRQGKQPYSVKIGDEWIEFRRLEPAFTQLRWMASIYDTFQKTGQTDGATFGKLMGAVMDSVRDATYLQGIENLMNAMEDPERFGDRFLSRTASGLVPYSGLLRGVAQTTDPYYRKPEGPIENIAAALPGLSQNVPAIQDAFGRDVERGPLDQGIGALVDPRRSSKETTDKVERELADVRKNSDLGPVTFVGSSVSGQKLDREGKRRYQQVAGEATYAALDALFRSAQYGRVGYEDKARMIERAVDLAREHAREVLIEELAIPRKERERSTILGR